MATESKLRTPPDLIVARFFDQMAAAAFDQSLLRSRADCDFDSSDLRWLAEDTGGNTYHLTIKRGRG